MTTIYRLLLAFSLVFISQTKGNDLNIRPVIIEMDSHFNADGSVPENIWQEVGKELYQPVWHELNRQYTLISPIMSERPEKSKGPALLVAVQKEASSRGLSPANDRFVTIWCIPGRFAYADTYTRAQLITLEIIEDLIRLKVDFAVRHSEMMETQNRLSLFFGHHRVIREITFLEKHLYLLTAGAALGLLLVFYFVRILLRRRRRRLPPLPA